MDVAVSIAHRLSHVPGPLSARTRLVAGGAGVVVLTTVAATLGAAGPADNAPVAALLRASMVAAPLGVALYAWTMPAYARFARLLGAAGAVTFATTLAESGDSALYTAGRISGWALEVLLVVALLGFPAGRLATRADRRLAALTAAAVTTFFVPALLLSPELRVPSPYTSCTSDCPPNALFLLDGASSALDGALFGAGRLLIFGAMVGVLMRLQQRMGAAGPLERQMLVPVLAAGMARVTLVGIAVVARDLGSSSALAQPAAALIAWTTPCIALAFLVGLLRSRLFAERAVRRLTACVRGRPDVPTLQRAFAGALDDPTVGIVFPRHDDHHGWMDWRGAPVELPRGGRHTLHLIHGRDGAPTAALVCDEALTYRPELLGAVSDLAAMVLENLRLTAAAEASSREANASRGRIAAAADRERRRIERDLHDGAQQRLVALRIELGLMEDLALRDPARCAARIRELEGDVEEALDELRSLAHGVCPPLLADRGLAEALQAAATRSTVPVSIELAHVGRYSPEIESSIYFCVLEALQNVAKHARGARRVIVRLSGDARDELRFSVRDDGAGARDGQLSGGAGVTNMHDRVAAVGGELRIASRPGTGTEVRGRVPVLRRLRAPGRSGAYAG